MALCFIGTELASGALVCVYVCEMNEMWQFQPFGGDLHS